MLTQEQVHFLFDYHQDGYLIWKNSVRGGWNGKMAGYPWPSVEEPRYRHVKINKRRHQEHRVIFLYHYGYLPESIDHINGNGMDNRIENLRAATLFQNAHNRKATGRGNTAGGIKGICWHKASGKWLARVGNNGKENYLGVFSTIEEAERVVREWRERMHGEYARHE